MLSLAAFAAIAGDLSGFYALGADIDLGGNRGGYATEPEDIDYVAGNAWHCPTNTEPYASMSMRTPLEVVLGDHPYVWLGVNPTTGSEAPTKVQLKYKAGTGSWETLTMETAEPHGDGWQAKYDGNDYYASFIPTNKFEAGMTVQYYFYLEYTNSLLFATTSVGTTDQRGSIAYLGPTEAKARPFMFTVGEPPPGGFMDPEGSEIADPAVVEWLSENSAGTGPEGTGRQRTVSSSSQRVVARFESFDRFISHDFSPMPSDAENTLPWP